VGVGVTSTTGSPVVNGLGIYDDGRGPALYAAGLFDVAGGQPASGIARWSGSSWSSLGQGLMGTETTRGEALLAFDDGTGEALYVGGIFGMAGGQPAMSVARWYGCPPLPPPPPWEWDTAIGQPGMSSLVSALATFDDGTGEALYAGGGFLSAGDTPAARIARWNGHAWAPLGGGVNGQILTMTSHDDGSGEALYVGGSFTSAAGVSGFNRIARWNGATWSTLGSGMQNNGVNALAVFGQGPDRALYAGGSFTSAGGVAANGLARWDGESWSPLASQLNPFASVFALQVFDDGTGEALYAAGQFNTAGSVAASNVARWDGTSWTSVGGGFNQNARALAVYDDGFGPALYAAGSFTHANGMLVNRVSRLLGGTWVEMDGGLSDQVLALAVVQTDDGPLLYAGGRFLFAGDTTLNQVAAWGGTAWFGLDGGTNGRVESLVAFDDGSGESLYIGGAFTTAGGQPANRIARWRSPDQAPAPTCPADVTGDGVVNLDDLDLILSNYGQATSIGDTNGDGIVNLDDLDAVLAAFGTDCP